MKTTCHWVLTGSITLCCGDVGWGQSHLDSSNVQPSSHMIVTVKPGVAVKPQNDGGPTVFCGATDTCADCCQCESGQHMASILGEAGQVTVLPYLATPPQNQALAAQVGLDRMYRVVLDGSHSAKAVCEVFESTFPELIQDAFVPGHAKFLSVEPNDPLYPQQWPLNNIGQGIDDLGETLYECNGVGTLPPGYIDDDMDVLEAWSLEIGHGDVVVAVIDSGADLDHPELIGSLVDGYNFIPGEDPQNTQDSVALSHGTAISGIIAAESNNGIGISGICWGCQVMPIRIGDWAEAAYFNLQTCAEALVWATDHGAEIANMSWGVDLENSPNAVKELSPALEYAHLSGVVLVAAAGNFGNDHDVVYPACDPNVIGVGATTVTDEHPCFSHSGPALSVTAPGVNILTTWNDDVGEQFPFCPSQSYCVSSGTSYSTAMVVGVAGLVRSANRDLSSLQVKSLLESTSDDLGEVGFDEFFGHGRINAYRAVCEARRLACVGDLDGDDDVDVNDLLALIGSWEQGPGVGDVNCDFMVSVDDLLETIGSFGLCNWD